MSAITRDDENLAELDAGTCEAWQAYSQRLRDLSPAEYELAEPECWAELQRELRRLERRRKLLNTETV